MYNNILPVPCPTASDILTRVDNLINNKKTSITMLLPFENYF